MGNVLRPQSRGIATVSRRNMCTEVSVAKNEDFKNLHIRQLLHSLEWL